MKVKIDKDLQEIIPNYLSNRQSDIANLTEFIKSEEIKEVQFIAHRLAGSAGSYGFNDLGTYAREMEQACKENDLKSVEGIFSVIKKYIDSIEIEYVELD